MAKPVDRRNFLRASAQFAAGVALANVTCRAAAEKIPAGPLFRISLAQWSLHRSVFGDSLTMLSGSQFEEALHADPDSVLRGELDPLELARTARREFDIDAVEYVNTFFFGRAKDREYLREMKSRAEGEGVRSLLIMCDAEGELGAPDEPARTKAVENHYRWVEAAKFLGCHSIRVNAASRGSWDEQMNLAADGLRRLAEFGDDYGINVLVENHGGLSSNGQWLSGVMQRVAHPRIGTLPDFGNFRIGEDETYDNYQGMRELMPYAKAVSAKSHDFDPRGDETVVDFRQMMRIVLDAGYRGYVGIEYEGQRLSEREGIRATKDLLERVRDELTGEYAESPL
ncbi:MAG: sugar phosphate isomerase/epimerase family protein [Acidobacteriota bacterium]